ncbi:MAG: hypothetical protein C0405_00055, partial [Desulfovibrio sp.]|nr:hypothetical protein [Desulfovibrio sp.]
MSILVGCQRCNLYLSRKNKVCPKCGGSVLSSKKFRVNVVTNDGSRYTKIVEGSLAIAKKVEDKLKGEVAQKKHLNITKSDNVDIVWQKYFEWSKQNKKSWEDDQSRWKLHIEPIIGNKNMANVKPINIERIISSMRDKTNARGVPFKPGTIKNVLQLVTGFFNWSIKMEMFIGDNPCDKITLPAFDNTKTSFLKEDEMKRLKYVLDIWPNRRAALLVYFALNIGMRLGEICSLKWNDIDFKNGFLAIKD